jgi:flavodoxin I
LDYTFYRTSKEEAFMKTIVIYDSLYSNTEQVAKAIGGGIGGEVKIVKAAEADTASLGSYDLIIIGGPTQGGRHTMPVKDFLDKVPADVLKNKNVATFDTRLKSAWVKIFGFAAPRIADALKEKGGNLVKPAEGFFVKGRRGPLLDGELERAAAWAKTIAAR